MSLIKSFHALQQFIRPYSSTSIMANPAQKQCAELLNLPRDAIQTWLDSFDTVLTDCDGVLWMHNNPIKGSPEVINKLQEIGKKVFFVTNNSTKTRTEFAEKAAALNFNIKEDGIVSTAYTAAKYLQSLKFDKKVFLVGSYGLSRELDAAGIRNFGVGPDVLKTTMIDLADGSFKPDPEVGAVVVGFDEHFSFPKMYKAGTYLDQPGCLFIATNTDERFPMSGGVIPGTGSMVRCIEVCAGRPPLVMGKPNPHICKALMVDHNIDPARTLMIGDRCNTDILLGTNCGFQTLLVGTGIHQLKDVAEWLANDSDDDKKLVPDVFLPRLGDLLQFL